jgi:hypothetical protein
VRKLRQEDGKFEASLGYTANPCFKKHLVRGSFGRKKRKQGQKVDRRKRKQ